MDPELRESTLRGHSRRFAAPRLPRRAAALLLMLLSLSLIGSGPTVAQSDPDTATASDRITIYVFKSATCPHCQAQRSFTDRLAGQNERVDVRYLEIMRTTEHHELLRLMADAYDVNPGSVPMVFLGDSVWVGDSERIRSEIKRKLDDCLADGCRDARAIARDRVQRDADAAAVESMISIPLLGTVDLSVQPLLLSTAIIAFVDGFNPCSLWLLTILIALVLHSGSRRRVLIVGLAFLATTAAVYGFFMVGVFSVLAYAQYLPWMYWIVAAFALLFGLVNVKDYFWFKKGFSFTIDDRHKPGIFKKFRELMINGRSPLALAGATVVMALGIALIELPCTAGFPVIWSGLVSTHQPGLAAFAGLLLAYLAIYLLDELVVFFIAVWKLRIDRFQENQAQVLKLVGGVVMIALAIVLVTEPEIMGKPGPALGVFAAAFATTGLIVLVHRKIVPRLRGGPEDA
ncbi:MAG: thioredoxin [Candidatus Wenzhouxiangella sp. M2_3B_020]